MNAFKFFFKKEGSYSHKVKQVSDRLKERGYLVYNFDLDTIGGLTEGAFHSVITSPTVLLVDHDDQELVEWKENIPPVDKIIEEFHQFDNFASVS